MRNLVLPPACDIIFSKLSGKGVLVGGCVRDFLMSREPEDYDFAAAMTPEELREAFEGFQLVTKGEKHGTVGVVIDGRVYEITSFRSDGAYTDNRRPENVFFTNDIREDAARRDFTVNAISYCRENGFQDYFGGIGDIENRLIRAVGDPGKRFNEDALRILRALRFASTLGFDIEEETSSALRKAIPLLSHISGERISSECRKLLRGRDAVRIVSEYKDVVAFIFGDISIPARFTQDDAANLALLLTGRDGIAELLAKLKYDAKTAHDAEKLGKLFQKELPCERIAMRRLLSEYGVDIVIRSAEAKDSQCSLVSEIVKSGDCLTIADLNFKGGDAASLGICGVDIGRLLTRLLNEVIEDKVQNKREELYKCAKSLACDIRHR